MPEDFFLTLQAAIGRERSVAFKRRWGISVGDTVRRSELHDQFGGDRAGAISRSAMTPHIFVFGTDSDGLNGLAWAEDGALEVLGMAERTDEQVREPRNRALVAQLREGRVVRVFEPVGSRRYRYLGEFVVDQFEPLKGMHSTGRLARRNPVPRRGPSGRVEIRPELWLPVFRLWPTEDVHAFVSSLPEVGRPYLGADAHLVPEPRMALGPTQTQSQADAYGRGLRAHRRIEQAVADAARARGMAPLSPRGSDVPFDVAWLDEDVLVLIEVKSLTPMNERDQLRYGLGQLLEYAQRYRAQKRTVRLFLVAEGKAPSSHWSAVARSAGVKAVGERQLDLLFVR